MSGEEDKKLTEDSIQYITALFEDNLPLGTTVEDDLGSFERPRLHINNPEKADYIFNPGAMPANRDEDPAPPYARLLSRLPESTAPQRGGAYEEYVLNGPGGPWGEKLRLQRHLWTVVNRPLNDEMQETFHEDVNGMHCWLAKLAIDRLRSDEE